MRDPPTEKPRLQLLKAVRVVIVIPIMTNVTLVVLAVYVAITALHSKYPKAVVTYVFFLASVTFIRVIWLIINGCIQAKTASVMIAKKPNEDKSGSKAIKKDQRRWYRLWLWWNRLGTLVLILQVVAACLMLRNNDKIQHGSNEKRLKTLFRILPVAILAVVILGWFTGSEVMSWRSLYTGKNAWKAHYREAFRCCIREALCCMGRYRYLVKDQKEEIYSVAKLLSHLVTYRAEGCSHLEVLAGISLLRGYKQRADIIGQQKLAPEGLLREASILYPYAVAAYTGPLLELGRYPYCWPLVWLYSQGFWSFWKRSRFPDLKGDNLWKGHAAAFLRHARLRPDDLRGGRVLQTKRESAYFVVVLHEQKRVVVAVRGTETPEDLLTDGLSRESSLSESDLLGLLKGPQISKIVDGKHYAHRGIIQAARELSIELDNLAEDDDDAMAASDLTSIEGHKEDELPKGRARRGLLSNLFTPEGGCEGYELRLVGHSLGGSICALTGLRPLFEWVPTDSDQPVRLFHLYKRYPKLHVYAFGVLPCVDVVIAEACQNFITSVVYQDEFSSRLSVASIMRLRANALKALSEDTKLERTMRIEVDLEGQRSCVSSYRSCTSESSEMFTRTDKSFTSQSSEMSTRTDKSCTSCSHLSGIRSSDSHNTVDIAFRTVSPSSPERKKWSELRKTQRLPYMFKGGMFLCAHTCFCVFKMSQHHKATSLTLSKQQNMSCDSMTRLVPPADLVALTGPNGVTESKGDTGSNLAGTAEGQFVVVNIETQSFDKGSSEEPSDESSGHDYLKRKESDLLPNGMPTKMGSGFDNISGEGADANLQEIYKEEMFLPGQVLHIRREEKPADSWRSSFWNAWKAERKSNYHAVLVDRKEFRELVISPSMFIDHMPWKCQHALNLIVS